MYTFFVCRKFKAFTYGKASRFYIFVYNEATITLIRPLMGFYASVIFYCSFLIFKYIIGLKPSIYVFFYLFSSSATELKTICPLLNVQFIEFHFSFDKFFIFRIRNIVMAYCWRYGRRVLLLLSFHTQRYKTFYITALFECSVCRFIGSSFPAIFSNWYDQTHIYTEMLVFI